MLLILGCLAAVALFVILAWWITTPSHRINEESLAMIQEGMTKEEVGEWVIILVSREFG